MATSAAAAAQSDRNVPKTQARFPVDWGIRRLQDASEFWNVPKCAGGKSAREGSDSMEPGGRSRVTIIDVAQAAGVSKSTVSLVLQGSPLVRPATQEKVRE